jgi:hypothetical protein
MTFAEYQIYVPVGIYLLVPALGVAFYIYLRQYVISEVTDRVTLLKLKILFMTYGGLLLLVLTTLFWQWSGMASLGTAYLVLGAPVLMSYFALSMSRKPQLSRCERWIFNASLSYLAVMLITVIGLYAVS